MAEVREGATFHGTAAGSPEMNPAQKLEEESLAELKGLLEIFRKFETPLRGILKRKYSPEQLLEAEGKKCIVAVSHLRFHELVLYFQVSQLTIKEVEPYEDYDTFVQVPLWRLVDMFRRVLSGQKGAFTEALASGEGKILGRRAPHDIIVWSDSIDLLAENIQRLRSVG